MHTLSFKSTNWWKGETKLFDGQREIGSIAMRNGWAYSRAEIHIGEKHYEIGYKDWWGSHLYIKDQSGKEIAESAQKSWWSWASEFTLNGRRYTIATETWGSEYLVKDDGGEVVRITPNWWKGGAEVSSLRSLQDETNLLLAMVLYYRYQVDAATAAVAAV